MERTAARAGGITRRDHIRQLEPAMVRLLTIASAATAVIFAVLYVTSGDPAFFFRTVVVSLAATVGVAMAVIHRTHAFVYLMVITVAISVLVPLAQVQGTGVETAVALVVIGLVGGVFVRPGVFVSYLALFSTWVFVIHFYSAPDAVAGTGRGAMTAAGFLFGSIVFAWFRRQTAADADRYRNLFARAPVSIWEEDFTEVAEYLDELRRAGVTDLAVHLSADPEAVRLAAGKIEVKAVNDAAVALVEAESTAQLVGRLNPATLTDDALRSIVPQLLAVWEGTDHIQIDVSGGRTMAGKPLDAILSWTAPRIGAKLDLTHVIVAIVDVTAIRRTQAQLEALLAAKDEFVASVSHELRTPLTAVVGLATELRDSLRTFTPAETSELVELIAAQGEEVAAIVEDLLVAAKATSGTLEVDAAPVDVVREIEDVLKGMKLERKVPLESEGSVPAAYADAVRLRQIVRNLLVNAQRYGGPRKRMSVDSRDGMVCIEVRDSGQALPDDEREAIFDRYYRARQVPGVTASVGLGLTLSRELARRMGGDLYYHHDGGEAVFRLEVPVASRVAA